ncbi:hypothetical protein IMM1_31540 [Pseudocoprococcus immobilis]
MAGERRRLYGLLKNVNIKNFWHNGIGINLLFIQGQKDVHFEGVCIFCFKIPSGNSQPFNDRDESVFTFSFNTLKIRSMVFRLHFEYL